MVVLGAPTTTCQSSGTGTTTSVYLSFHLTMQHVAGTLSITYTPGSSSCVDELRKCRCSLYTGLKVPASDAACAVTPDSFTNIAIHFLPLGLGSGFLHGQIQAQGLCSQCRHSNEDQCSSIWASTQTGLVSVMNGTQLHTCRMYSHHAVHTVCKHSF